MDSREIPVTVRNQLSSLLEEFYEDLRILYSQDVLTHADIQKIRNQAEVSRDGILETLNESGFDEQARTKLLDAMVRDFETSVQRIIETVVARKGQAALVIYKLNKADKRILARVRSMKRSQQFEQQISSAMLITKAYILRTLPNQAGMFGKKVDVERIVGDYSSVFLRYLEDTDFGRSVKLIGPTDHE